MKSAFELTFRQSKLGAKGAFATSSVGLNCTEEEVIAVGAALMVVLVIFDEGVIPTQTRGTSICSFTSLVSFGGFDTAKASVVAKDLFVEDID